ncbi:MAG: LPS export ABC transporter permease LptF [Gammaproteobacteria bacterium]|nr:MAG: LPS export ABC transporter permease LptF [Gammaproteobacteria bacterium]
MLINRYLTREILTPLATICAILVVIFSGYSITRYLPDAANGLMTGKTVLSLVFLKIIVALEVLVPVTLFLSVISALGRMYAESEIIAMGACGLGERTLFWAVFRVSLLVAVLVAGLSLYARPWAYEKSYWLKAEAEANFDFSRLRAGRFHEIGANNLVVFIENIDVSQKRAEGIFIQQRNDSIRKITRAKEAWQEADSAASQKVIVLRDGYHYELSEDGSKSQLSRFKNFRLSLIPKQISSIKYKRKAASTLSLAGSSEPEDKAEFQWRISTGFSTILLGLLGVPLARTAPRRGKYANTFVAVIVFAVYYNMTVVAKTWMEQEVVGSFPGIWWPLILLAVLLVLLLKRSKPDGM